MNGPTCNALREACGLSYRDLAEIGRIRVTVRAAQFWCAGSRPVPADIRDALMRINATIERLIEFALAQAADMRAGSEIALCRYRTSEDYADAWGDTLAGQLPWRSHCAMLGRLAGRLQALGYRPAVIEFDPVAYRAWLPGAGMEDGESARAVWTASKGKSRSIAP